eukprot:Skav214602  [mRNA]  locus=scaffold57:803030:809253:- [translate_table: standard]
MRVFLKLEALELRALKASESQKALRTRQEAEARRSAAPEGPAGPGGPGWLRPGGEGEVRDRQESSLMLRLLALEARSAVTWSGVRKCYSSRLCGASEGAQGHCHVQNRIISIRASGSEVEVSPARVAATKLQEMESSKESTEQLCQKLREQLDQAVSERTGGPWRDWHYICAIHDCLGSSLRRAPICLRLRSMANLRYLYTFIDEESHGGLAARSKSLPELGGRQESEAEVSAYVAQLQNRRILTFGAQQTRQPQTEPVQEPLEPPVEVLSDAQSAVVGVQVPLPSPGSRGHPVLCRRPCVYFAKGTCEMGDACDYCHVAGHARPVHPDRRQRIQLRKMATWLPFELSQETADFAALHLPHLRRGFSAAGIDGSQILAMIEEVAKPSFEIPEVDANLRQCLKKMPLATQLGRHGMA